VPIVEQGIYNPLNITYFIEQVKTGMVEEIIFQMLLKWHFDVFGLIEHGIAIDINEINK
jgi:hypothetical protein